MCGGVVVGLIGTLAAFAIARRVMWRRHGGGGCGRGRGGGGGCGGGGWRGRWSRHGGWGQQHHEDGHGDGWGNGGGGGGGSGPTINLGARLADLQKALDLNARQSQDFAEAFGRLRDLGVNPARAAEVVAAVGAESFDVGRVRRALDPLPEPIARELIDSLEHAHNILTPEQRQKLRDLTRIPDARV